MVEKDEEKPPMVVEMAMEDQLMGGSINYRISPSLSLKRERDILGITTVVCNQIM